MTELIEYRDKITDAVKEEQMNTALQLLHQAMKEFITSKKDRDELRELLDYALQLFTENQSILVPEVLKDLALLALLRGDLPTGKILYENLKQHTQKQPDPHAQIIMRLWENKLNQKDAIFSLQELREITVLGIEFPINNNPTLLGNDVQDIERLIRMGYGNGHYILSIMEDKTNVLQDVEIYHGSSEEVEIFQEIYHGEIDHEE